MKCSPSDADWRLWFGTRHYATWLDWPDEMSLDPVSWGDGGTLLGGGGWQRNSQGSHREFVMQMPAWYGPDQVNVLQAFRDGAYSTSRQDLIYWHDPFAYSRNVLPKQWAQTDLLVGVLGGERVPDEISLPSLNPALPRMQGKLPALTTAPTAPGRGVLYQPIPDGYEMHLISNGGQAGTTNSTYARTLSHGGAVGPSTPLATMQRFTGDGVLIYFLSPSGVTATQIIRGTLEPLGTPLPSAVQFMRGWVPGMGNSGCRFVGNPTYVPSTPWAGGLVDSAFTLREVGDWIR